MGRRLGAATSTSQPASRSRYSGFIASRSSAASPVIMSARGMAPPRIRGVAPRMVSDRNAPEREPALELGLDGQVLTDLGLQPQLALVVALLLAARRHERIEGAALVVVDPVQRPVLLVAEGEHGGEDAVAVAAALDLVRDGVDTDHEVLEVGVADDHPAVAVLVVGALDAALVVGAGAAHDLLHVARQLLEVGGRERLEHDRRLARRAESERELHLHVRRRHREQAVGRGLLELALAAKDVEEAHALTRRSGPGAAPRGGRAPRSPSPSAGGG